MGKGLKQTFLQDNIQMANKHEKMLLNIINHQNNANQNYNEVLLHIHQNGYYKNKQKNSVDEDVEKLEALCPAGAIVKVQLLWKTVCWFLKTVKIKLPYMMQQSHFWIYVLNN